MIENEPPVTPDDTKPKAPVVDTSHLDETGPNKSVTPLQLDETGPSKPVTPPAPQPPAAFFEPQPYLTPNVDPDPPGGIFSWFLALVVVAGSGCMCLAIIALSGFAGVRDEMSAIGTEDVQTLQADIGTQYVRGNQDFERGDYEIAEIRFEYVETKMPGYEDAAQRLEEVRSMLSATATPTITPTPMPSLTPTPDETQTANITPTRVTPTPQGGIDPADLYGQAETAMTFLMYEDAIEWLEALRQLAPNYRRSEVTTMLIEALTKQGGAYLRGANSDGEDRLMQGVQLINRAIELGYDGEWVYEKGFVERYLSARSYLEGGAYPQALEVLYDLCDENCDWGYRTVTVREMILQAGGSPQ